jgi:hypothetical protein
MHEFQVRSLTSAQHRGDRSASGSGRFIAGKLALDTYWIGDEVETVAKGIAAASVGKQTLIFRPFH